MSVPAVGPVLPSTLTGFLRARAADGDAVALVEGGGSGRTLGYAGLEAASEEVAALLAARGVGAGDTVAVWLPNWLETVVWQFAVARLGAAVLGVNTRYHRTELAHLLTVARPRCVALPDELLDIDFAGRLRAARAEAGGAAPTVAVVSPGRSPRRDPASFDLGAGTVAWTLGTVSPGGRGAAAPPDPSATAVYFTTSGSTGLPKLAGHDQASIVRHAGAAAAALSVRPGDVMLVAVPLVGVLGFVGAFAALGGGATVLLQETFDADRCLDDMHRHGVTHAVGGDDLYGRLLDADRARPRRLPRWRWAGIGHFAGRVGEVSDWAGRRFGTAVCGIYGSSELFALTSVRPAGDPPERRRRAGGLLVDAGIEVRAADPETGAVLPLGETGELQFRGYPVTSGYRDNPSADAAARTADGWFRTGDLGFAESDRSLCYVCRAGDALRLSGFLVEPAEIEQHLAAHPAVTTARVVGVRSGGADTAVAFVTGTGTVDEATLRAHCASGLAKFKVPTRILLLDEFPTTSGTNGTKIRNAVLRDWAEQAVPAPTRGPS